MPTQEPEQRTPGAAVGLNGDEMTLEEMRKAIAETHLHPGFLGRDGKAYPVHVNGLFPGICRACEAARR
jgi:hypothetical protein